MKKILFLIYIIVFATLVYYVVNIFVSRDHNSETSRQNEKSTIPFFQNDNKQDSDKNSSEKKDAEENEDSQESKYSISRDDCFNNCAEVEEEAKAYCKETCGLSEQRYTNGCEENTGLEKDYCWKDSAIKNSNYKICEEISDKNIYETCTARITEDLMSNTP
ncbi:MAG: hypothetical protein ABFQ53_03650 [Patescibacteria group bacterium]